jgi:CheY-like chemotaxis protein
VTEPAARTPNPPPTSKAPTTVLVVDSNATSRRFVELALGRNGFGVETAQDGAAALEILKLQAIHLIVSDTELVDMDGLRLYRRLTQESRLQSIPFVFLSADTEVTTKIEALRAGVDDYLVKPCEVAELVARASALVARQRRIRQILRSREFSLAGDLAVLSFSDVVNILEMARRSGVLSVVTPNAVGQLHFDSGDLLHAVSGNLVGVEAFMRLIRETSGHFEFTLGPCSPETRTVHYPAAALILEAARRFDTEIVSGIPRPAPPTTRPPPPDHAIVVEAARRERNTLPTPRAFAPRSSLHAPPLPNSMTAAQFELAIRESFALGDLAVWSEAALATWTSQLTALDRFHALLVADLPSGVSAMLALGAAPTEQWVLDSLSPDPKTLGLVFSLRHERMIDVVLVDVNDPAAQIAALRRVPAVVFVCPPGGNLLALSTQARLGLSQLIEHLAPPAVVGVGNQALAQGLAEIRVFREGKSILRCTEGAIGDLSDDLRGLLVKGIRLWASTASPPQT